jgi:hypothetical protein
MLRDPDRFPQFRESLKDLLNLSSISQDQMRDRLLMLSDIAADRVALDARQLFGGDYDRIRQRRDALARFKQHAHRIEQLVRRFAERETLRGALAFRWLNLRDQRQALIGQHDAQVAELRARMAGAAERRQAHLVERNGRRDEHNGFQRQLGALEKELADLEARGREFGEFIEDLARAMLAKLKSQITRLRLELADAERETRERAEQKLEVYRELVRRNRASIEHFDRLVVTALRRHFSEAELESLFRLLEPHLLETRLGPGGAEVRREAELLATLRELLGRIQDGVYSDSTVRLALGVGRAPLAALANPDTVRERLAEEQQTLERWERVLEAIHQRESLLARLRTLEQEEQRSSTQLLRFEQFRKSQEDEPRLRAELERAAAAAQGAASRLETLDRLIRETESEARDAEEAIRNSENEFNHMENRFRACIAPAFDSPPTTLDNLPEDLDGAITLYERDQKREETLGLEVTRIFHELELHFGDRYTGGDEAETVRILEAELEALPEHENALARDWNAHLHALKSRFDHVLRELGEIQSAKDRLNRDFARIQISNLESVKLEVLEACDTVGWIRRLASMEQPGLFDDNTRLDQALANFRRLLEANPVVRFSSLFVLRFAVMGADGVAHHYQDFRQIESHGTTITIKVLFNLLVLKSLLRREDCLVPFFLDEVQSLDPANRRAILTTARKLGFIAITAAPDAITEVHALYFLLPRQGRIVLTSRHRYEIQPLSTP